MLEDDFTYVLKKALMGHGLAPADAAARAGLSETEVMGFLRGAFSADTARKLADALSLDAEAYAKHPSYEPDAPDLTGIRRLDLPFAGEQVNAWIVRDGESIVLIDAGYQAKDLLHAVKSACGRLPDRVFITHGHHDHVAAIPDLVAAGLPVHAAGLDGTIPMKPGDIVFCGRLEFRAADLSGHAIPALGFHIGGLAKPVVVTGDAIFAGSIGGCKSPAAYQQALRQLRSVLGSLPGETVLLPGHGPATTLASERASNPFL